MTLLHAHEALAFALGAWATLLGLLVAQAAADALNAHTTRRQRRQAHAHTPDVSVTTTDTTH